ncbi:GNAT family N-acetyltransferase [Actinomadura parmotrematis]|uniref:GNAT family N-acetyltransferase n=1 Tax=Actinomadura parmotrematis TaxID=2864039 RepID=A0ABS7FSC8_9ACTN|nr:GNAT family N-acetyltransferase [Actinomadura parmotrematis]MBW8483206.1 GNAT family N-acetyltransferase [Actinomadura parmotrematis]
MSPSENARPPERIVHPAVVLRRLRPADAPALHEAAVASHDELHRWMPWATDPPAESAQVEFAATSHREWDEGASFVYLMFDPADAAGERPIGTVGLHARIGPGALEIGYWVHSARTGRGLATTGAGLLTAAAFRLAGVERVEIHCDRANRASAAVPRKLGFRHQRTEDHAPEAPAETGRREIWVLDRAGLAAAPAAAY